MTKNNTDASLCDFCQGRGSYWVELTKPDKSKFKVHQTCANCKGTGRRV